MNQMSTQEYTKVEDTLRNHLRPYHPDPGFVSSLKHRITEIPGVELEFPRSNAQLYIRVIAIVSGFAVLFWILRRIAGGK